MAGTVEEQDTSTVKPAHIAALAVSIAAILIFGGASIYLLGRHKGLREARQRAMHSISHSQHSHTRLPEEPAQKYEKPDRVAKSGRLTKLKDAFGIKTATPDASSTSAQKNDAHNAPRIRATSPLQIGIHPGTGNPYSGTEEFQAAVHNLLGYSPQQLAEWYPESEDDARENQHTNHPPELFSPVDECGSPLPAYEETETEPRRFSWQGQESDYRPEKS